MVVYNYVFIGALLIAGVVFALLPLIVVFLIAPRKRSAAKYDTYECGVKTYGETWVRFRIQYYIFALMFVVFDIETVFLYPWAVGYADLGAYTVSAPVSSEKTKANEVETPPAVKAATLKEAQAKKDESPPGNTVPLNPVLELERQTKVDLEHGFSPFAFYEMVVFLVILFSGLAYAWAKGVLRWV